jgi:DNA polymerase III epsilon subunit-like protein
MLQQFIAVANVADELVGHNGDKFDLAWIRTRCLFHGIEMFPDYVTIDTLKIARQKFRFNSNRLNYIADFLGIGTKIKTEYSLWKDILLHKDKEAMAKMIKYCQKDVVLLEKVYKALSLHIKPKTHYGVIFGGDRGSCPECGSEEIIVNQRIVLASGLKKLRFRCNTCGKYHSKTDK